MAFNAEGTLRFSATKMPRPGDTMTIGNHLITWTSGVCARVGEIRVRKTRRGMVHAVAEYINRHTNLKANVIDGSTVGLKHK